MGKQEIIDRIISDARASADSMIASATAKAEKLLAEAEARCSQEKAETERECQAFAADLFEKKAAAARLESAKVLLAEKRKVLDYIYAVALAKLKESSLQNPREFYGSLLEKYAEQGDVVYFAKDFAFVEEVSAAPVFAAKGLRIATEGADIDGGVLLIGEKADKDVSLKALIALDKERYLSQIAAEIF